MKRVFLCLLGIIGLSLLLTSGCSFSNTDAPALINQDQIKAAPGNKSPDEKHQEPSQQPHGVSDFRGPGAEFKGGKAVTDYNLAIVRRVNHPEFTRLVFQFTGAENETGEAPPEYTVRMENEKKISMRLKGVVKAEAMEYKSDILTLSEMIQDISFTRETNGEAVVSVYFNRPVAFQVFDLAKPARVVVVLRPDMGQMNKI